MHYNGSNFFQPQGTRLNLLNNCENDWYVKEIPQDNRTTVLLVDSQVYKPEQLGMEFLCVYVTLKSFLISDMECFKLVLVKL